MSQWKSGAVEVTSYLDKGALQRVAGAHAQGTSWMEKADAIEDVSLMLDGAQQLVDRLSEF